MDLLVDGWHVLQQDAASILLVATCMLWGGVVIVGILPSLVRGKFDAADALSLAAGAWIVPALLASGLALLIGAASDSQPLLQLVIAVLALVALWFSWPGQRPRLIPSRGALAFGIPLAAALAVFVLVRLAFTKTLALPLYFDSAAHYGLILQLLHNLSDPGSARALVLPVPAYYHLGYHILLAGLIRLVHVDVGELMLVSGQLVLAAAPLPLYLLAHRASGSRLAALMAVLLGSAGWYMPAHAVNWGKYPALFSILAMISAINFAVLALEPGVDPQPRRILIALSVLAAATGILIQTRSIIVLTMTTGAWILSSGWRTLRPPRRSLLLVLALLIAAALGLHIAGNPLLAQVLDPYLGAGAWITGLVAVLCVFAFRCCPRTALASLLASVFLLAGLSIPAPRAVAGTLLDRPLVEMLLFAPLSLLGAAGLAGLLRSLKPRWHRLGQAASALILGAVVAHALANYSFRPAPRCVIVATDDLVALDWLEEHSPADAQVIIASAQLRVAPTTYAPLQAPADAGVWIQPLTGLQTTALPSAADFGDHGTLRWLCELRVKYVYVGNAPQSFDPASLQSTPGWYRSRLQLPAASIYEVMACGS